MSKVKLIITGEGKGLSLDAIRKVAADRMIETTVLEDETDLSRYLSSQGSGDCVVVMPTKGGDAVADKMRSWEKRVDDRLHKILISAGIPSHIKGSKFLRDAVKASIKSPEMVNNITKMLYPAIAEQHNTSPSKVERAIRHAIDVSWSRGKIENTNQVFGIKIFLKGEKPTNGELIALIADRMMIEIA